MKPREYLEYVRMLVDRGEYRQAVAFAERESERLERRLSRRQLGSLSVLMEHANLVTALRGESSPCEEGEADRLGDRRAAADARTAAATSSSSRSSSAIR